MARLVGVDLPRDKRMEIALTYIYGIGRTRSQEILEATGIDRNLRTKDLTDDQVTQLRDYIEGNLKVEGDLRREVSTRAEAVEAHVAALGHGGPAQGAVADEAGA